MYAYRIIKSFVCKSNDSSDETKTDQENVQQNDNQAASEPWYQVFQLSKQIRGVSQK